MEAELIERSFGPYQVEALIGRGGMGSVYRALDTATGARVALKVIGHAADVKSVRRLQREAASLKDVRHPNVVALRGEPTIQGDSVYFAMELLSGFSLQKVIATRGRLPVPEAISIALSVLDALEAAHDHGVVHRDVKPANLFITQMGEVKVLDFGLALMRDATKLTVSGDILGTPVYMSPEQCQSRPMDGRTDIYSLGCVLYELLTGKPPFHTSDALALLRMHIEGPVPPIAVPLPPGLETAIGRALAKDPALRYSSAGEFAATLRSLGVVPTDRAALAALGAEGLEPTVRVPGSALLTPVDRIAETLKDGSLAPPAPPPPIAPEPYDAPAPEELYWTGSVALTKTIATGISIWAVAASIKPRVVTQAESATILGPIECTQGIWISRTRFEPGLTLGALGAIVFSFVVHGVLRLYWRRAGLVRSWPERPVPAGRWVLAFGGATGLVCALRLLPALRGSAALENLVFAASLLTGVFMWFFVFLTALEGERTARPFYRDWRLWLGLVCGFGPLAGEFVASILTWVPAS